MEQEKTTTSPSFKKLTDAIDNAEMSTLDRVNIYKALVKYIENDTKILNNLTNKTWNVDTKQS